VCVCACMPACLPACLSVCNPCTGLDRPWGLQEVEAPRFQENRHMNVVRLSARSTRRLYPQERPLVLISVTGWVDFRAIVRLERLSQWKILMGTSGIEPATFRVVAQRLNRVPLRLRARMYIRMYNMCICNVHAKCYEKWSYASEIQSDGRTHRVRTVTSTRKETWLRSTLKTYYSFQLPFNTHMCHIL
jgi:hypothetical protein